MLPTTLRNALLSIAVFLPAHVLADDDDSSDIVTFQFSACVSTCLGATGYSMDGEDNQKEMCKASRDGLLEAITACLVSDCLEELVAVDANLLQPMQTGCKELEKPVSDDEIEDAANAAANIQATIAASTSTSTTSLSPEPVTITPTIPSFQPLGVETETSTTPDLFTIPMPTETPTIIDPAEQVTTSILVPSTVTEPTFSQPEVPAETQTTTLDLSIPSETQPPPETVTSAEPSSSSAAVAIVPLAQITDISPAQPAPEATTAVAEQSPSPTPSPPPASVSTSTQGSGHTTQNQPDTTLQTTVVKPTTTDKANTQPPQHTTPPEQGHANNPIAPDTTTSTEASKTQASEPKATHSAGVSNSSSQQSDDDNDEEGPSSSGTSTATPDISGELVMATGTPTASASSLSGFATSVTAVTAVPSASGTQTAASDDVDDGLGGGSPFSVVMASAATSLGNAPCLWAPLFAMMGMLVSLTL